MTYLADTVTVIRHFSETGRIAKKAKTILDAADQGKHHIYPSYLYFLIINELPRRKRTGYQLHKVIF